MWEIVHEGLTYNMEAKIGQGYTAEVYKASSRQKTICVKVIHQDFLQHSLGKNLINNEIKILKKLEHPQVLKFIKKEESKGLMIVTEYCEGGTLFDLLRSKGKFAQKQANEIMKQIIEGCQYIHQQGVIHRDLKPQNVFFTDKTHKNIKIADFGFAVNLQDSKLISANVGSPLYMPYEALTDKKFSTQSDIFALGVMWFELLTGKTPFQASTESELQNLTKKDQIRKIDLHCSKKVKQIIYRCLKNRIQDRPSLLEMIGAFSEANNLEKCRSKTFYNGSKELVLVVKDKKASKENICPQINQLANNRNRCRTNLEIKVQNNTEPISKLLSKNIPSKTRASSKQSISGSSHLSKENLLKLLNKLQKVKLSFLPHSVQDKFTALLKIYQNFTLGIRSAKKVEQQLKKDDFIYALSSSQSEQDICIAAYSFVRRLIRLAKTYKEYGTTTDDLSTLWGHIQAQCLVKG